jgi:hypothetical protein
LCTVAVHNSSSFLAGWMRHAGDVTNGGFSDRQRPNIRDLRYLPREANRTSFGRLMVAGICIGLAMLFLAGLSSPTVPGVLAALVMVPLAVIATWSWWTKRPARVGGPPEISITSNWMRAQVGVVVFFLIVFGLAVIIRAVVWLVS